MTPGFPAFLAVLWYFDGGSVFWSFLAAIAVHELAHAAVLLLLGGEVRGLRLGFAQLTLRTGFLSTRTELLATAAGPGVNLLSACLLGRAAPRFAAASLLLGAFNLLPVYPLDGGRLLCALLRLRWGLAGERAGALRGAALQNGRLVGRDSGAAARAAAANAAHGKSGCFSGEGTVK